MRTVGLGWLMMAVVTAVGSGGWGDGLAEGAWAQAPSAGTRQEPLTGMTFIWVPGGCFQMGCTSEQRECYSDEMPEHRVCLDGYWMGKYEVRQQEWSKIFPSNPSHFSACGGTCPVENVTWYEAVRFCNELSERNNMAPAYSMEGVLGRKVKRIDAASGYRLPTEAEWEFVCRDGGKPQVFPGKDALPALAWFQTNSQGLVHPAGLRAPNSLGFFDMGGNVWEWCQDTYHPKAYEEHGPRNPVFDLEGDRKVIRGGSWRDYPRGLRCSNRSSPSAGYRGPYIGFRVAKPGRWQLNDSKQ